MKLIQAMKQVKDLLIKAEDLRKKIALNCAHHSIETPTYGDRQKEQVSEWLQAHGDIIKEICRLRVVVQRTNILTNVKIEVGGKVIEKSIAEWIHRRRDLATLEGQAWSQLTDKNLREGFGQNSMNEKIEIKIIRNYDPKQRDDMLEIFRSEPTIIDSNLETVNAITDLIEK